MVEGSTLMICEAQSHHHCSSNSKARSTEARAQPHSCFLFSWVQIHHRLNNGMKPPWKGRMHQIHSLVPSRGGSRAAATVVVGEWERGTRKEPYSQVEESEETELLEQISAWSYSLSA
ncbi:hypothetical protein Y1Q_0013097 [Alligator mississippiensis]|uniref:Uncharacterized protein n=1 Tax=Alligator mississippiensis TaxID=8496 RepID=A0A151NHC9_ALLMI|nr:hypothetical protein Y1Q_0013097 [Alligator mississippiensis]